MQWTNVFVILFCTEFRSNGRKKTSSHLKYLNPIILKVCLESDRGLIRQILATQPRLGPRQPSLSPQSRGRVSGGDIVDLVLLDTSSVNMKRALFWKRKKSNKRFTNWLQSFHFIKGLDHGTVSIDYTVQCSAVHPLIRESQYRYQIGTSVQHRHTCDTVQWFIRSSVSCQCT